MSETETALDKFVAHVSSCVLCKDSDFGEVDPECAEGLAIKLELDGEDEV